MKEIKLFVCGDIINMFSTNQFISDELIDIIKSTDYAICNFDGTCEYAEIQNRDMVQKKGTLSFLKKAGFDLMLLANNHVTDYEFKGLTNTLNEIDKHAFDRIGASLSYEEAYRPLIKTFNEVKIGFFNLCEAQVGHFANPSQSYGYAWIGEDCIDDRIVELRKNVDFLILFIHAGLENYRLPLNEFRKLYKHYCDLGVNVVIGGHPHIAQGIEPYNDSIICYSLGNFYFPRMSHTDDIETWSNSYSIIIKISNKGVEAIPIYHSTRNLVVSLCSDTCIDLKELSEELKEPLYSKLLGKQNEDAFKMLPYRLYKQALCGTEYEDNFFDKLKFIFNYLFNYKGRYTRTLEYRKMLLKRLVENETYRYLTIAALSNIKNE